MALPLHIPECIQNPPHEHHPPPFDKPLRIQIEGPLVSVKRLVPDAQWHIDVRGGMPDIQPAGIDLARVAYRFIYGQEPDEKSLTVRDESLGWVHQKSEIDYYGVTFDHLVPSDEDFPEVLQINIIDVDEDGAEFANSGILPFHVDASEYTGQKVLAVPRCCQRRKGTTDRKRVNGPVVRRDLVRNGLEDEIIVRILTAYGLYEPNTVAPRNDPVPAPSSGKVEDKKTVEQGEDLREGQPEKSEH